MYYTDYTVGIITMIRKKYSEEVFYGVVYFQTDIDTYLREYRLSKCFEKDKYRINKMGTFLTSIISNSQKYIPWNQ